MTLSTARLFLFTALVSSGSILVLSHGLAGAGSDFTAAFLVGATATLGLSGLGAEFDWSLSDFFYCGFIVAILLSFAFNGPIADRNEIVLLVLTLLAYPAARLAPPYRRATFLWITGVVVTIGTTATLVALAQQWNGRHGKPFVFGEFDAAPIQFLSSAAFFVLAWMCAPLNRRRTAVISVAIFVVSAIYAAAQVRFTFVAIAAALLFVAMIGTAGQRKYVFLVATALIIGCAVGLLSRRGASESFMKHEMDVISQPYSGAAPAGCVSVDLDNSIAIRHELLREAFAAIPQAGLIGIGLNGFMRRNCIQSTEVHNSFLQALIEFGWLGGGLLGLLVLSAVVMLLPLARYDGEVRFVLSSLVFILLESLIYGRLSRDGLLFLFLGYAAGLHLRLRRTAPLDERQRYHLRPALTVPISHSG
jgi:O-antigen ligase/polysaccharide polymerase Wzy-like membrane protein